MRFVWVLNAPWIMRLSNMRLVWTGNFSGLVWVLFLLVIPSLLLGNFPHVYDNTLPNALILWRSLELSNYLSNSLQAMSWKNGRAYFIPFHLMNIAFLIVWYQMSWKSVFNICCPILQRSGNTIFHLCLLLPHHFLAYEFFIAWSDLIGHLLGRPHFQRKILSVARGNELPKDSLQ